MESKIKYRTTAIRTVSPRLHVASHSCLLACACFAPPSSTRPTWFGSAPA